MENCTKRMGRQAKQGRLRVALRPDEESCSACFLLSGTTSITASSLLSDCSTLDT